ncbi:MAG: nuclear transport factor 2 family protein [Actinomycetota bacterium]|nr:nuclear transport factor 2 family protein [Actinomycetota bacterium]
MTAEVPEPVARLLAAANDHDTDAFLASFTEDGVVDDWGREFVGPVAIREWSDQEFIGVEVSLKVTGVATTGDETTITADVGGKGYTGPSHFAFKVRRDLVARMTIRQ